MRDSDLLDDEYCAGCGGYIANAPATGVSDLYFPGPHSILLCEPCYEAEDEAIERAGTNDLPDRLAAYRATLARIRN